jgi:orotidine-5'-phosphate decarboxylase
LKFCQDIVESTSQFAAAYKPNSAFFEALGPEGLEILKQVISLIPRDIPVILDNKRGDIDTTAQVGSVTHKTV